jgi:hypothetical protein
MPSFPEFCRACQNYCPSDHLHCAIHPGGPDPEGCRDHEPTVLADAIAASNDLQSNINQMSLTLLDNAIAAIATLRETLEALPPITTAYRPPAGFVHHDLTTSRHIPNIRELGGLLEIRQEVRDQTPNPNAAPDLSEKFVNAVALMLVNQHLHSQASLDRLCKTQQEWLRCLMVGCTEQQILQHQEVVIAIAQSQTLFSNQVTYIAGLQLLYRNVAAGLLPFPSTDPRLNPRLWSASDLNDPSQMPPPGSHPVWRWADTLWNMLAGDEGRPMAQSNKVRLSEQYLGFMQVAQAEWSKVLNGSGATENNDA